MLAAQATATEEQLSLAGEKLLFRWGAPHRIFHNTRYLASLISHIDELSGICHDADLLRIVAWYLGAVEPVSVYLDDQVFDARVEECQAYLGNSASQLGVPAETISRLQELVSLALHHISSVTELDGTVIIDADLAVLACTPQEYKKFRLAIREENAKLSDFDYQVARRRFVRRLLKRKSLFKSPTGSHWEAIARQNLEAELANLDASLEQLDPQGLSDAGWVPVEETDISTTSTTIFKRSAIAVPEAAVEETCCVLPRFVTKTEEAQSQDYSSLEFEPDVLDKAPIGVVRRLSAKELARQAAKHKQL